MISVIPLLLASVCSSAKETRVYKYKSSNGVIAFSDIEPLNTDYEEVRIGCYACAVNTEVDWYKVKLYLNQYQHIIRKAALEYQVEPAFIRAVIHAESHFDVHALSKQGAQGLMQLMPKTAKSLGVHNAFIARQNINGGVKHLAKLLKKYRGDTRLVTAAYNAGEGAVKKYEGIPPFAETKVYVERVEILHERYKKAISL